MNNKSVENNEIDLMEIFGALMSKLWIMIICGILFGALAFLYSYGLKTPMYTSTTSVYILNKRTDSQLNANDTALAAQLAKDYQKLIKSRTVVENVIEKCELDTNVGTLSGRIVVAQEADTRIINISVKDANPNEAQRIANEVRNIAAEHIKNVTDVEAVNVVDYANLPAAPSEPNVKKITLLGIILGVFLSAAIIVVVYLLDDTIKTSDDVEKYLGLSTLALIPAKETVAKGKKGKKASKKAQSRLVENTSDEDM